MFVGDRIKDVVEDMMSFEYLPSTSYETLTL